VIGLTFINFLDRNITSLKWMIPTSLVIVHPDELMWIFKIRLWHDRSPSDIHSPCIFLFSCFLRISMLIVIYQAHENVPSAVGPETWDGARRFFGLGSDTNFKWVPSVLHWFHWCQVQPILTRELRRCRKGDCYPNIDKCMLDDAPPRVDFNWEMPVDLSRVIWIVPFH
jgi:hypothetical protein